MRCIVEFLSLTLYSVPQPSDTDCGKPPYKLTFAPQSYRPVENEYILIQSIGQYSAVIAFVLIYASPRHREIRSFAALPNLRDHPYPGFHQCAAGKRHFRNHYGVDLSLGSILAVAGIIAPSLAPGATAGGSAGAWYQDGDNDQRLQWYRYHQAKVPFHRSGWAR